jgi:hypothetical protein
MQTSVSIHFVTRRIRSKVTLTPITEEQYRPSIRTSGLPRNVSSITVAACARSYYLWKCDGQLRSVRISRSRYCTSLDQPLPDGNGTLGDYIPDRSKPMEDIIADRMLLKQLFARLRELDPEADPSSSFAPRSIRKISDRAIARELGRPQKTFADQMKKYLHRASQDRPAK